MGHRGTAERHGAARRELDVFPTGSTVARRHEDPADRRQHPHDLGVLDHAALDHAALDHAALDPAGLDPDQVPSLGDRLLQCGELVRDGIEHARDFQARPGRRPGAAPVLAATTSSRAGGDTDIVRPVLVSPRFASEFAITGQLFAEPIPHLSISHCADAEQRFLIWDGVLECAGRPRSVTFHLLASPSMVVTVLELVPCHRLRRQRQRFVDDGVAAVDVIARRLQHAARSC